MDREYKNYDNDSSKGSENGINNSQESFDNKDNNKNQVRYVTRKGLAVTVAVCIALSSAVGFGGGYL